MQFSCKYCGELLIGLDCPKCGRKNRDPFRGMRRLYKLAQRKQNGEE